MQIAFFPPVVLLIVPVYHKTNCLLPPVLFYDGCCSRFWSLIFDRTLHHLSSHPWLSGDMQVQRCTRWPQLYSFTEKAHCHSVLWWTDLCALIDIGSTIACDNSITVPLSKLSAQTHTPNEKKIYFGPGHMLIMAVLQCAHKLHVVRMCTSCTFEQKANST